MDLNEHNEVAVALALGSLRLAIPILEWSMLLLLHGVKAIVDMVENDIVM